MRHAVTSRRLEAEVRAPLLSSCCSATRSLCNTPFLASQRLEAEVRARGVGLEEGARALGDEAGAHEVEVGGRVAEEEDELLRIGRSVSRHRGVTPRRPIRARHATGV